MMLSANEGLGLYFDFSGELNNRHDYGGKLELILRRVELNTKFI